MSCYSTWTRDFQKEGMKMLSNLDTVLNPKKIKQLQPENVASYGNQQLQDIITHLNGDENAIVNGERAIADFLSYKQMAKQTIYLTLEDFAQDIIANYSDVYPDFCTLWEFYLAIPLNSVPAERGFSQLNIIKNKLRNRLSEERLDELMRISINANNFVDYDFQAAAERFRRLKERRH